MKISNLLLYALIAFLITANCLKAQDDRLDDFDFTFESEPLQSDKAPYFVIGVGYLFDFYYADFNDINSFLIDKEFTTTELEAPVFLSGASGFTSLGFLPGSFFKNMRFGFHSVSGNSTSNEKLDNGFEQSTKYLLVLNGFSLDYAIVPFRTLKLAFVPGITLGWGRTELEAYQTVSDYNWDDFTKQPENGNYFHLINSNLFYGKAHLNIEYAFTSFAMLQLQAGYSLSGGYNWKYNYTGTLEGVPDSFNSDGITLRAGIFLGLFNY